MRLDTFRRIATDLPVVPIGRGVTPLIAIPNHQHILSRPLPAMRGVSRSSQNVGQEMRWTWTAHQTKALARGRRSHVVLMPRRWHQAGEDALHHARDGDNKPDRRGERGV